MSIAAHSGHPSTGRGLTWVQGGLILAVLTGCTVWPRAGQPALLMPLDGVGTARMTAWARAHDLPVLGAGRLPGSIVVRIGANAAGFAALRSGALLLAVPGLTCTPFLPNDHAPQGHSANERN
jgi:hypothetical protein